ncbi:serine/threonine-protein kinase [Microtetraspora fusca]|uniref:serine/threonine-protein kinase n=1 Tax=Microtetraspora fusca TaxID=1997 RepID=UPI00082A338E|nr:serine/threonine-protein kinase [Microtetraspora fusca]
MAHAEGRLVGGRYHLIEPIGRGGMGIVWRAHDELLDRIVAVKEVRYDSAMGDQLDELNRRTMREARAAGRLTHPNVVVVHDVIEEDDRPWIIMQLVPSRSLGQVIREDGRLSPERTTEIGLQVLDALKAAHAQGVLHRDVKPENVLITDDGRVVLTDFGIARLEADSTMTRTGLIGTPAFIAPERLRGDPAQRESDLWSLGATLYAAVEGKPPHDRGMPMATMHAVLNESPAPAVHAGELRVVLERLLEKEPADRPGYDETAELLRRGAAGTALPKGGSAAAAGKDPGRPGGRVIPETGQSGWDGGAGAAQARQPYERAGSGADDALSDGDTEPELPLPLLAEAEPETPGGDASRSVGPGVKGPGSAPETTGASDDADSGAAKPAQETRKFAGPTPGTATPGARTSGTGTPGTGASRAATPAGTSGSGTPGAVSGPAAAGTGSSAPADRGSFEAATPARTARPVSEVPTAYSAPGATDSSAAGSLFSANRGEPAAAGGQEATQLSSWSGGPAAPARRPVPLLRAALVIVPALLVVASVAGYIGLRQAEQQAPPVGGAGLNTAAPGKSSTDPSRPPTSPSPSQTPSPVQSTEIPKGWKRYTDKAGFSIALPKGWKEYNRDSGNVYFRGSDRSQYLQIGYTSTPGNDALKDWKNQEKSARYRFGGYKLIGIRKVDYFLDAADWEFTWRPWSGDARVINRGFVTDNHHGYAIFWKTKVKRWKKDYHYFETFTRTFTPAK